MCSLKPGQVASDTAISPVEETGSGKALPLSRVRQLPQARDAGEWRSVGGNTCICPYTRKIVKLP